MKALTISQPFAETIASGRKWVENRTWATDHRGPLAIHAGKGTQYLTAAELRGYATGVFVATCELVTCLDMGAIWERGEDGLPEQQRAELAAAGISLQAVLDHQHTEGPIAWVLTEIRRCEPIPATGKQQLWELPPRLRRDHVAAFAY